MRMKEIYYKKEIIFGFIILIFLFISLFGVTFITPNVFGNITNATTKTYVNVTNTEPRIYKLEVTNPVILTPGNVTVVWCNASVFDWNGWQDVKNGTHNATLYDIGTGLYDYRTSDDNNYHYTNVTCQECTDLGDPDGTNASCKCAFYVWYYANDTEWQCNFTVKDSGGAYGNRKNLSDWNVTNTNITALIAIDVPQEIDYGELAVTENSSMKQANLTNFGNIRINVSVEGWGGDNETQGQNLSMICRRATDGRNVANISVGFERYSVNPFTNYPDMINLTSDPVEIGNFTLYQRINDNNPDFGHDKNATYWRIYIPPGVTGFCNGTLRFIAEPYPGEPGS